MMKVNGRSFKVTNQEKVFYPEKGYTKEDIMAYYKKVSPYLLPHLKGRPLTMVRYPDGIDGKKFYQKNTPDYFPEWIKTQAISKKDGGTVNHVIADEKATLIYLASQACLTLHSALSTVDQLKKPDRLIVDLDPSDGDFKKVRFAAKAVRSFFEDNFEAKTYVMTTGSRGLHVLLPLKPELPFGQVLKFAQKVAGHLAEKYSDRLTTEARKENRGKKIYLDVMRNALGQTAVAPYSLRARPNAPVATPLEWDELATLKSAQDYSLSNLFNRLGQKEDPWKNVDKHRVSLKKIRKEFEEKFD